MSEQQKLLLFSSNSGNSSSDLLPFPSGVLEKSSLQSRWQRSTLEIGGFRNMVFVERIGEGVTNFSKGDQG